MTSYVMITGAAGGLSKVLPERAKARLLGRRWERAAEHMRR
jgi:hypothetical protein